MVSEVWVLIEQQPVHQFRSRLDPGLVLLNERQRYRHPVDAAAPSFPAV